MTISEQPWVLEEKAQKTKNTREKMQMKELLAKNVKNVPVSTARIIKFLDQNKDRTFTNAEVAKEVTLSISATSGILDKLEEIGVVKVTKIRKSISSGISQVYQSSLGNLGKVEKERVAEGVISKALKVFNKNVNKTYKNKDIAELIETSKNKVSTALSILLITGKIKVVGSSNRTFIYQNIEGNKEALKVTTEPSSNYMTLNDYLTLNNIKGNIQEFKSRINNGHLRLFYSNKGPIEEYEISYLQKVIKSSDKKEGKEGNFSWLSKK